jgi:hypothetical protein
MTMIATSRDKDSARRVAIVEWLVRANEVARAVAGRLSLHHDAMFSGLVAELCPPAQRTAVTNLLYDRGDKYRRGGALFEMGLFSWEECLFEEGSAFPRRGSILVGGVGGGRLLQPLRARRYRVLGFDPSRLLAHAHELARNDDDIKLAEGRYQDLGAAVSGLGPLAALLEGEIIHGVILAFGSITHLSPLERRELLLNLRKVAPSAPVFLSFVLRRTDSEFARLYRQARARIRRVRRSAPEDDGAEFLPGVGFVYLPSREELVALCETAGYELTAYAETPYGRALAIPR